MPYSLPRLGATLDLRFWLIGLGATGVALALLGIPTAVIPNPFFVRVTPTEPSNLAVWLVSAPLIGLVAAVGWQLSERQPA